MNKSIKNHKKRIEKELKNLRKYDSKKFWNLFKNKRITEHQPINELYDFYKNTNDVYSNKNYESTEPHLPTEFENEILNSSISNEEII